MAEDRLKIGREVNASKLIVRGSKFNKSLVVNVYSEL